jgi:hypothetical protein
MATDPVKVIWDVHKNCILGTAEVLANDPNYRHNAAEILAAAKQHCEQAAPSNFDQFFELMQRNVFTQFHARVDVRLVDRTVSAGR